jgi:tetratricopeptide (TPR) repeat protein
LCGSREVSSRWADRFLGLLRTAWSDPRPGNYVRGTSVCLSSLLAAGRHQELLEVLALLRFAFWHYRKFGLQALLSEGRTYEALAYAEASRGLNQPDASIDPACEKILLDLGRVDEAYGKYALTANASSTGLATFRAIVRKYPTQDPKKILLDLATSSGDAGRWFAAAKDAGLLGLALEFAEQGSTDLCQPVLERWFTDTLRGHYIFLAMPNPQSFCKCCLTAVALEYVLSFSPVIQAAAFLHHCPPQSRLKPMPFVLSHRLPPLFFASVRCRR